MKQGKKKQQIQEEESEVEAVEEEEEEAVKSFNPIETLLVILNILI